MYNDLIVLRACASRVKQLVLSVNPVVKQLFLYHGVDSVSDFYHFN